MLSCDPDYMDAYGLELVAGRGFSEDYVDKLVINETAARTLGYTDYESVIGEEISVETIEEPMQVIGVVKDYHQQALNRNYTPIMLFHKDKIDWIPQRYISIVMKPGDSLELVSQISEIWTTYFADWRIYRAGHLYFLFGVMDFGYVLLCCAHKGDGHSQSIRCFTVEFVLSVR